MAGFDSLKVMVIDPAAYSRSLLRDVLTSLGVADIAGVDSCAQARSALTMRHRDVIFLSDTAGDIVSFVRALRRDTATRNITVPVFLVSAGIQQAEIGRARDAGLNGIIVKPVSAATVEKKLRLALAAPKDWVASMEFIGPDRRGKKERRKNRAATRERRKPPAPGAVVPVTPKMPKP
jgi:CheY-like chemotaxis protein